MTPRLCVITALRNCATLLPAFTRMIDSFEVQPTRVVIGVNDSTDGSEELLRRWNHPALDLFVFNPGAPALSRFGPDEPRAKLTHPYHHRHRARATDHWPARSAPPSSSPLSLPTK
jgi:hypothetical protein